MKIQLAARGNLASAEASQNMNVPASAIFNRKSADAMLAIDEFFSISAARPLVGLWQYSYVVGVKSPNNLITGTHLDRDKSWVLGLGQEENVPSIFFGK